MIYRALLDTVLRKTSDTGAYAPVALPASQKIVAGGTGMTKAKLIAAKAMFRRNECDEQNGEGLFITYNADMLTQILSDTTLTSADFMAVKMLQEGAVSGNWLGFKWLAYENWTRPAPAIRLSPPRPPPPGASLRCISVPVPSTTPIRPAPRQEQYHSDLCRCVLRRRPRSRKQGCRDRLHRLMPALLCRGNTPAFFMRYRHGFQYFYLL